MTELNKNYCRSVNPSLSLNYLDKGFNLNDRVTLIMGKRQLRHIYGRSPAVNGCEHCYKATMDTLYHLRTKSSKKLDAIQDNYQQLKEKVFFDV